MWTIYLNSLSAMCFRLTVKPSQAKPEPEYLGSITGCGILSANLINCGTGVLRYLQYHSLEGCAAHLHTVVLGAKLLLSQQSPLAQYGFLVCSGWGTQRSQWHAR
jgi:hypothetical protein